MTISVAIIVGELRGGIGNHVLQEVKALRYEGFEVFTIFSRSPIEPELANMVHGLSNEAFEVKIRKLPGIFDLLNSIFIYTRVAKFRPHVIHGHGAKGGLYARLCRLHFNRKPVVVYTPHGGSLHEMFSVIGSFFYRKVERLLVLLTSHFIFESSYSKNRFMERVCRLPDSRYSIISNGIDVSYWKRRKELRSLQRAGETLRVVCVGILRYEKGQDLLLRAVENLSGMGVRLEVRFVGKGPLEGCLRSEIVLRGMADHVTLVGHVSDVRPHYEWADVVSVPSRFESFGYVCLEAFASDCLLVASSTGGILDYAIDDFNAILHKRGDASDLAHCLLKAKKLISNRAASIYLVNAQRTLMSYQQADKSMELVTKIFDLSGQMRSINP